ncbi:hypothetical protein DFH07DRAFT_940156 [Mycena maculata]|uniref:Uncharacterized protein n=1 Tax=Mycena maculata TaxID=230809 RepID=A0AAD7NF39_9AGAR|nr:hypothetical protein DFH07DRAFT_940156 [Mycena maculata]
MREDSVLKEDTLAHGQSKCCASTYHCLMRCGGSQYTRQIVGLQAWFGADRWTGELGAHHPTSFVPAVIAPVSPNVFPSHNSADPRAAITKRSVEMDPHACGAERVGRGTQFQKGEGGRGAVRVTQAREENDGRRRVEVKANQAGMEKEGSKVSRPNLGCSHPKFLGLENERASSDETSPLSTFAACIYEDKSKTHLKRLHAAALPSSSVATAAAHDHEILTCDTLFESRARPDEHRASPATPTPQKRVSEPADEGLGTRILEPIANFPPFPLHPGPRSLSGPQYPRQVTGCGCAGTVPSRSRRTGEWRRIKRERHCSHEDPLRPAALTHLLALPSPALDPTPARLCRSCARPLRKYCAEERSMAHRRSGGAVPVDWGWRGPPAGFRKSIRPTAPLSVLALPIARPLSYSRPSCRSCARPSPCAGVGAEINQNGRNQATAMGCARIWRAASRAGSERTPGRPIIEAQAKRGRRRGRIWHLRAEEGGVGEKRSAVRKEVGGSGGSLGATPTKHAVLRNERLRARKRIGSREGALGRPLSGRPVSWAHLGFHIGSISEPVRGEQAMCIRGGT